MYANCDECGAGGALACICEPMMSHAQHAKAGVIVEKYRTNVPKVVVVRTQPTASSLSKRPAGVSERVVLQTPYPSEQPVKCCSCGNQHRLCDRARSGSTTWCPECSYTVHV